MSHSNFLFNIHDHLLISFDAVFYLIMYSLFNDTVTSSECIASDGKMIVIMNCKGCGWRQPLYIDVI
jgi:hypothetical protein